jgi:Ser/Thr protein kinase RdoA (MazF antagonist)
MDMALLTRVLAKYNLTPAVVGVPQKGYRNSSYKITLSDGTLANLMLYKDEQGIVERVREANRVSDFLHKQGLPTRRSYGSILAMQSHTSIRYCALYNYLPGQTIPWEAYSMDRLKALGAMMSTMHHALQSLPIRTAPRVTNEYAAIVKRMQAYFDDPEVAGAIAQKLGLYLMCQPDGFRKALRTTEQLHGQQQLHMDFVRGNILFTPGTATISGVIDFEKTGRGHRLLDIARTLAFLLVDCKYKSERDIRKYFLHSGYRKRGRLPLPMLDLTRPGSPMPLFEELINLFLLHDFYKFLRHNPYEYLAQNEHFARTKEILLKRKIIARIELTK